jgi:hypothetical protein
LSVLRIVGALVYMQHFDLQGLVGLRKPLALLFRMLTQFGKRHVTLLGAPIVGVWRRYIYRDW